VGRQREHQVGLNLGLLDTQFVTLGQAGEGTVPAYNPGDKFAGAPDMTATLWGQHDWTLDNGRTVSARIGYTWTDDYTTFAGGPLQRTQEAYGLLNAQLVYDPGSNWQLIVQGTNLTDEYYSPAFFYTVSQQMWDGSVGRPREVFVGLKLFVRLTASSVFSRRRPNWRGPVRTRSARFAMSNDSRRTRLRPGSS
jgi:outer membrane receptor protein involved in Fe transport